MIRYFQTFLCFYTRILEAITKMFKVIMQLSILTVKWLVFVTRELSKGVTTLSITKVLQRDHRKIKTHVTTSQQRHKKRVQPQL